MIMYSFFDEYDFSDKTIIPFSTHGGSGLADTISTIQELEPNANVYEQGLSISRNDVENSSEEISQWLEKVRKEQEFIMRKNVLVLSGSPRKNGNSDMLCDAFIKGAFFLIAGEA